MAAIEWSSELSVGIQDVDTEHQNLVRILNDLDEAMRAGKGSRIMEDILTRLLEYTVSHFESEERLMKESEYPKLQLHQSLHRQLVEKAVKLQKTFRNSGRRITRETMDFLKYWLTNHIMVDDMAFGKYYTKRSRAGSSGQDPEGSQP